MTKSNNRTYMTRRGRRYLIERKQDGTFGKFIPIGKAKSKKDAAVKKTKTSSNRQANLAV